MRKGWERKCKRMETEKEGQELAPFTKFPTYHSVRLSRNFCYQVFHLMRFADTVSRLAPPRNAQSSVLRIGNGHHDDAVTSRLEAITTSPAASGYDSASEPPRVGMNQRPSYRVVVFFFACFSSRSRSFCCFARSFLSFSMLDLKSLRCFFSRSRCCVLVNPRDFTHTHTHTYLLFTLHHRCNKRWDKKR